jgi:hypothetical protein
VCHRINPATPRNGILHVLKSSQTVAKTEELFVTVP